MNDQQPTAAAAGDKFTKLILTVDATLIAAGVIALWQMTANMARLEERVGPWTLFLKRGWRTPRVESASSIDAETGLT